MIHTWKIGGVDVKLIAKADSIVAHLRAGKSFEPDTLKYWAGLCESGGTVVDVGCYTGVFSILSAKLGCKVIAFEPIRENYERCLENFELNGVTVDLRYACASDHDGPVDIQFNPHVPGLTSGASLIRPSGGKQSKPHRSLGVTIDSLALERCAAIKIDVERGEPFVLKGARETLERCRPVLVVEVLGKEEGRAVLESVSGYEVTATLDERNWVMIPK